MTLQAQIWTKTRVAWRHVYQQYKDAAEWFVKADDDTYLEIDNLKQMLAQYVLYD